MKNQVLISPKKGVMQEVFLVSVDAWTDRVCHRVDELLQLHGLVPGQISESPIEDEGRKLRVV